jgi:hypothetical protein
LVSGIHTALPDYCFLEEHYLLNVSSDREVCEDCNNQKLKSQRIARRYPIGILLGQPLLQHHIKKCPVCKREYPYEELSALVPPYGNYAYDIIIEIGNLRFLNHRQNKEIQKEIQNRYHLFLSESSINELAHRFLDYFAAVHYARINDIRQVVDEGGGYVAHFDGTCEAGTDILFTAIDEISGFVLLTTRMPTENIKDIKKFIEKCRNFFGVPLATMRDMSTQISMARDEVFDNDKVKIPDLICQYHFLENVGEALFKRSHQELFQRSRKLKIKPALKSIRNGIVYRYKRSTKDASQSIMEKEFKEFLLNPYLLDDTNKVLQLDNERLTMLRKQLTYFILRWLDDYSSELKGEYFPFDQPHLVYHRRCIKVYDLLSQLIAGFTSLKVKEKQTLQSVIRILEPCKTDEILVSSAQRLEKEVKIFEELRELLRFSSPGKKSILRQHPPVSTKNDVSKIQERLKTFLEKLKVRSIDNDQDISNSLKIMIAYLEKYADKLVGHLITLPGGDKILLERTNNISEQHFSRAKIGWRRKLGTKKLTRQLQAARHEEFLCANLKLQKYIDVVYDGSLDNMPNYFAKYRNQALEIRNLRQKPEEKKSMPVSKNLLRQPGMLKVAFQNLEGILNCMA